MEQDEVHGDEGGHEMKMIKLNLEKKKEKNKNHGDQGKGIAYGFCFGDQDTIESVITFRIDRRTIKKGNLWLSDYRVSLGDMILAYAFRDPVC